MTAAALGGGDVSVHRVEGSTRRWEADADGMRVALAAHDEVLRAAIEAHGGWLFKHTGDGVCAAFASPRARWMPRWPRSGHWSCRCGSGMATGEAELREGDYFGAVLNRAARVMAAGHGGQILLADSTAVLLSGVDLVDLGPRRLRDMPTPVGVFQVRAAGLRDGLSGVAGAGCESGEPAASDHELHRARVRGRQAASRGEGSSVGDVDRGGWGRQDPPGAGSGGAAGR